MENDTTESSSTLTEKLEKLAEEGLTAIYNELKDAVVA